MKITTFGFGLVAAAAMLVVAASPAQAAGARAGNYTAGNHIPLGYLGIDVRDVSEENVSGLRLKEAHGAEIIRVDHDGPAGKIGLREHDVVLQMNGVTIEGEEHIRRMLRETPPGRNVTLTISRDGQQITMQTQMADRGEVERQAWEQHLNPGAPLGGPQAPAAGLPTGDVSTGGPAASGPVASSRYSKSFLGTLLMSPSYTGAMLESMSSQLASFIGIPNGSGLFVRKVIPNSPADMAGIRAGDIVTKANLQPVGSPGHWAKTIREAKGRPVTVTVMRDRQEKTLTLVPESKKRSGLEMPGGVDTVCLVRLPEL